MKKKKKKLCARCKIKKKREGYTNYCIECSREYCREWYLKNRKKRINDVKNWQKENNYASEKTSKQRKIRYIKRETRRKYPLGKKECEFCNELATEHHHYTNPPKIDKFNYVCHNHHIKLNRIMNFERR